MTSLALLAPLHFIVEALKPVLVFFHDTVGVGWGMSIVLLTICVRALMAPLTIKQFKSMQAMGRVAPELKALQQKYKDDKQRQQQEVMKFYQENHINPFASCLPLVAQLPFFLGLYYLLRTDLRSEICQQTAKVCGAVPGLSSGHEKFLFIPDLTAPGTGAVLVVLIVLYIGSQLLSTVLMTVTVDRNQKMLMYGLPFVFTVFIIQFPTGLIVYWITTNLWTVAQQWVLKKRLGPMRPVPGTEPVLEGAGAGGKGAKGGAGAAARTASANGARASSNDSEAEPALSAAAPSAAAPGRAAGLLARLTTPPADRNAPAASAKPTGGGGAPPPPPRKKKKRSGRRR